MILTRTEIEPRTDGLAMFVINRVLLTTILIQKVSSEPLILTGIYLERQSPTTCLTLQIRYDYAQRPISELPTSYSTAKLLPLAWAFAGENIREAIRTTIIAMFLSVQRAIQMVRSLISQC